MGRLALIPIAVVVGGCGSDSSSPPDATPDDAAPVIDAAAMSDADPNLTPQQACALRYGDAPGFELCAANPTACTFFARPRGGTCVDVCENFGGLCINSHDGVCDTSDPELLSCQSTASEQVCICSLL